MEFCKITILEALQRTQEVLTLPQIITIKTIEILAITETVEIPGRLYHIDQEENDYMIQKQSPFPINQYATVQSKTPKLPIITLFNQ